MFRNVALVASLTVASLLPAQAPLPDITTPKESIGFNMGDDYCLANNVQLEKYWRTLERESDRMKLEVIGESEEGRDMLMAIVTSPKNHQRLEHYRQTSKRLGLAAGLDDDAARKLAKEGKAVVWIDGGLHATEVLVAQQLIEMVYQMCAFTDEETMRFLDDVIILFNNPNPDGLDLVADWYMRNEDPKKRSTRGLPRLYQKYTGHDNNRDFYMATQKETQALCRVFYHQWLPQIVFNHHQTGPSGTVLFAPPFRGPHNHNLDPLLPIMIDLVGAAIHQRFIAENKPGATMRKGASYSTWWNGGLRTAVYFHNIIGLLTETIGSPTPMKIPLRVQRQLGTGDMPFPIAPQTWHFRQSVEYSITSNRAVLDVASRYKEHLLFNFYRMGKNSIDKGNRDTWTVRPDMLAAAKKLESENRETTNREERKDVWDSVFRDPARRDPRGYIIPREQADFPTATKFVNTLIKQGIAIHRATDDFQVDGRTFAKGSYVVKCAQAFRPHIIDMFEPQVHPNDVPYPGGPPIAPYDSAGWTLAFQMGVAFHRVLDGFDGPLEQIDGLTKPPAGSVKKATRGAGFFTSASVNDAYLAVNRLLRSGKRVSRLAREVVANGRTWPVGTFWVHGADDVPEAVGALASELGIDFAGLQQSPRPSDAFPLKRLRVGIWDRYGGSMPSGWLRWVLERFEFDFDVVYPPDLDKGALREKYDALIFVGGAIPAARPARGGQGRSGGRGRGGRSRASDSSETPEKYRGRKGSVTAAKTIPQLKAYIEAGGTVLCIGSSTSLANHLELPLANALVTHDQDGTTSPLSRNAFFVPGSILKMRVDPTHPIAFGAQDYIDVYFRRSPVFHIRPEGRASIQPVGWFDTDAPLRSGWAWGQHHVKDGIGIAEARLGEGAVVLFGPEVTFRAQPHATFKLVFNGLHLGAARADR